MPDVSKDHGQRNPSPQQTPPVIRDPSPPSPKRLVLMTALMGAVFVAGSLWIATLVS